MDKLQANINAARVAGYKPSSINGKCYTGNPYDKQQNAKQFDIFDTAEWHEAVMASLGVNHDAVFWMDDLTKEWNIEIGHHCNLHTGKRLSDALALACAEAAEEK